VFNFTALPPLSLYVHFPWCVRKCPYCDFNSHVRTEEVSNSLYIDALLADLEQDLPLIWGRKVTSVFIGGGTPSLLEPDELARLISGLRARLQLSHNCEITLEANPGTAEQQRFAEYRGAGINRLSLGIQSFNDASLQALGRIHGRSAAISAVEAAQRAGFENINLDLMFGLPGQGGSEAGEDIDMAIDLQPTHVSYYQLTLEPNTAFYHTPPELPDDEIIWQLQQRGQERLAAAGYLQYEVSAYARKGYPCRHNLNYWNFGDYLGIGAGAHGKLTSAAEQKISRYWKRRHPKEYMATAATVERIAGSSVLSRSDAALEFMLNALRLTEGVPSPLFTAHTGLAISTIEKPLQRAVEQDFLEWGVDRIRPTERGSRYLNELLQLFMED
jgi:putative oxygen-independent coproporphyrinogen III oxidase